MGTILRHTGIAPIAHHVVSTFWPEVEGYPLGQVTAHHLLTHTAGLPLRANLKTLYGTDPQDIRDGVLHEALHRPLGEAVEYTDRAALILGYLAEHLSGQTLHQLAQTRIWQPLGMDATRFGPLAAEAAARCAPTELDQETDTHLKGVAHDFSARLLGGTCGIAGVFSALDDLTAILRYMLDDSTTTVRPGFGPAWTEESLIVQTGAIKPVRGLFWHPAPGTTQDGDVWVHYGFTGTGMSRDRQPLAEIPARVN
jgi:CubicO group peptidase (beta-lactamase class C family)